MKYYVETNKTYNEAKAGENKTRRLITASEFFQIPKEELKVLGKDCNSDWWIENGLLAYGLGDGDRRYVFADYEPSLRLGVLYTDRQPHKHKFEKQPRKCKTCGELEG